MPIKPLTLVEFYTMQSHNPLTRRTQGGTITRRETYADVCHECFFEDCIAETNYFCPIFDLAERHSIPPANAVQLTRKIRRLGLDDEEALRKFQLVVEKSGNG